MKRDLDVVVVGGAGIDTNIYLPGKDIDFSVESNFTEDMDMVGQAGGYSARGFARLGLKTALIDALGDDYQGRHIRAVMKRDGVNPLLIFREPCGTRRSVNVMYRDGRRKNFYDARGSSELLHADLPLRRAAKLFQRAKIVHFSIIDWTRRFLALAKAAGAVVSCDIQDVVDPDDAYRQDYIRSADILFFSSTNFDDPLPLMRTFLRGNEDLIMVIGRGARGCTLGSIEGMAHYHALRGEEPVRDTNGAGDSLAVGFLYGHCLLRKPLEQAVLMGQIAARHACTLRGTSDGLITRRQLHSRLRLLQSGS